MNIQSLHSTYNHKIKNIQNVINKYSDGNDDLKQECMIGAYEALVAEPDANYRFLVNRAKWAMGTYLRKGRSVDNGFYRRKELKVVHYDNDELDNGLFMTAVSNDKKVSLDDLVIFRIDFDRFLEKLSGHERSFIIFKVMDELSDICIKRRLGVSFETLKAMKVHIREQMQVSFA
jgi:DNA-directed RNA polymerase specialized sigma24 family protein